MVQVYSQDDFRPTHYVLAVSGSFFVSKSSMSSLHSLYVMYHDDLCSEIQSLTKLDKTCPFFVKPTKAVFEGAFCTLCKISEPTSKERMSTEDLQSGLRLLWLLHLFAPQIHEGSEAQSKNACIGSFAEDCLLYIPSQGFWRICCPPGDRCFQWKRRVDYLGRLLVGAQVSLLVSLVDHWTTVVVWSIPSK